MIFYKGKLFTRKTRMYWKSKRKFRRYLKNSILNCMQIIKNRSLKWAYSRFHIIDPRIVSPEENNWNRIIGFNLRSWRTLIEISGFPSCAWIFRFYLILHLLHQYHSISIYIRWKNNNYTFFSSPPLSSEFSALCHIFVKRFFIKFAENLVGTICDQQNRDGNHAILKALSPERRLIALQTATIHYELLLKCKMRS